MVRKNDLDPRAARMNQDNMASFSLPEHNPSGFKQRSLQFGTFSHPFSFYKGN
nr:hypothetical protein [Chitinophaga sp. XS-30]